MKKPPQIAAAESAVKAGARVFQLTVNLGGAKPPFPLPFTPPEPVADVPALLHGVLAAGWRLETMSTAFVTDATMPQGNHAVVFGRLMATYLFVR